VTDLKLAVLASGTGTNLQALLDKVHGRDGIEVVAVASDIASAPALGRAQAAGIPAEVFADREFGGRDERDRVMGAWLRERGAEFVVAAGYMRILSGTFLEQFPGAVINVHPALLPAFPGLDAVGQALAYGVKVFGITIHFVDEGVDTGPVILQRAIELPDAREPADVLPRLQELEHELLPAAVRLIARGAARLDREHGRRVIVAHAGGC
jgi:phosphoribosylglycinamide formyltransferase-1